MKSLFCGRKWSNSSLGLDGEGLQKCFDLTDAIIDVSTLILFGSLSTNDFLPEEVEDKCIISSMIGDKSRLEKYIKKDISSVLKTIPENSVDFIFADPP